MEYFVYEIKEGIIIEDDIYLPKPLHYDSIPNTEVNNYNNGEMGQRGVIDIRDKPKTPPKGHTISIKPEENILSNGSNTITLADILRPNFDWFDENNCDTEFSILSKHVEYIGETQFVFEE
jgi:hypothetical protein